MDSGCSTGVCFVSTWWDQFYYNNNERACARNENAGHSDCRLVYRSCGYFIYGIGGTAYCWRRDAFHGPETRYFLFSTIGWWRSTALAASVLVFWPP